MSTHLDLAAHIEEAFGEHLESPEIGRASCRERV